MEDRHYFTDNSDLPADRREHSFSFSNQVFTFTTDLGVFSKSGVDQGTELLLNAVCRNPVSGSVLDLGCGYGTVGVVVKTLFPECAMTCVDINPRAVELAQLNAQKAHVEVDALVSDGFSAIGDRSFDLVITNPPIRAGKMIVYTFFEDAYMHLHEGGRLYAVVRRKQGADSAQKKLSSLFGNCEIALSTKGYRVCCCVKH